eukprot:CAMPEP_0184503356 /NCGR_PEP_ID=MMETSP0113_2-20130426/51844_1 /TAXON_ID=91329 /ORGANISM="Norrisiella sphaerica, Strain BC52" /LENGTH=335 /DNA_ID=CAMNT_0026892839 /DNA_START=32 /DNA_END=1039 /DNA_ORIENTATION=+
MAKRAQGTPLSVTPKLLDSHTRGQSHKACTSSQIFHGKSSSSGSGSGSQSCHSGMLDTEFKKALEEARDAKLLPTRAHGLATLTGLVRRMARIRREGERNSVVAKNTLDQVIKTARNVLETEEDEFLFTRAIVLLSEVGKVDTEGTLDILLEYLTDDADHALQIKIGETISQICRYVRGKGVRFSRSRSVKLLVKLVSVISAFKDDVENEKSIGDVKVRALLSASALASLGEACPLFSREVFNERANEAVTVTIDAINFSLQPQQHVQPELRRSSFFFFEQLLLTLCRDTPKVLEKANMTKLWETLRKARVHEEDTAARILAGRAAEMLERRVLT